MHTTWQAISPVEHSNIAHTVPAPHAQVFDCLPVAGLVAGDIFCVHGGLSPKLTRPEDVNSIKRPCKILGERNDLLSDLTWSDPHQKIKGELRFPDAP